MKRTLLRFIVPALVLSMSALAQTTSASAAAPTSTAAAPAAAPASVSGPMKLGIINIQQAIIATNEGQRDFAALQKKYEPKQNELQSLNKEIEDLKKQLDTQGPKMNEDARAVLVKNIEAKQKNLQRSVQDAQEEYQTQQNEIANRIGEKVLGVLDKFAKQNAFTVILDVSSQQSPVLWADVNRVDVTKEIVDAYNAESGVPAPAAPSSSKPASPSSTTPRPKPAPAPTPKPASPTTPKQ